MSASGTEMRRLLGRRSRRSGRPCRRAPTTGAGGRRPLSGADPAGRRSPCCRMRSPRRDRPASSRPSRSCRTRGRSRQVVEIEPVERLDVAGQRLGVVHRGRDQVVERRCPRSRTPCACGRSRRARSARPAAGRHRIELRLDRVRSGGDLAEGQHGRENLDEKHIHEDGIPFAQLSPDSAIRGRLF